MRTMLGGLAPLACLAALLFATATAAQPQQNSQPNALQGFSQNRNEPVKINAQTLEVRDKKKVATYSGNVVLVQGDTTMHCKTLVVYYDNDKPGGATVKAATPGPAGSDQIRRIEAMGSVIVTQKDQTATGDKAVYDVKDDTVRLYPAPGGYVVVTQGPNIVRGQHNLTVFLATGVSHFDGGVESIFVPNSTKSENHAGAPPAHAPPARATPKSRATSPSDLY